MAKAPNLQTFKQYFGRRKPSIQEIVREPTAGGIVFRRNKDGEVEFLLYQDARERWTIPKGHIEPGETAQAAAIREVGEETGLHDVESICWLGKVNFRYRRVDKLVLISQQNYLIRVRSSGDEIKKEEWMMDIRWFSVQDALDKVEYEDIGKLILLGMKKIRQERL